MSKWVQLCSKAELLAAGGRRVFVVDGKEVLTALHDSTIYAFDSKCPHKDMPLKPGDFDEKGYFRCPWHKLWFNLSTGALDTTRLAPPMDKSEEVRRLCLSVHQVNVNEDDIVSVKLSTSS